MTFHIGKDYKLIFNKFFPYKANKSTKNNKRNRVIIAIGGNIKNTEHIFQNLFKKLQSCPLLNIISTSPILYNPPFGHKEQNHFLNATILLEASLGYKRFFALTSYMERVFGRKRQRAFKNEPRTLDIDIIYFDKIQLNFEHMHIPHIHWHKRLSVYIPLFLQ